MADIVLGLITKNSLRNLRDIFIRTLGGSIQVPYEKILLVDSGGDRTIEATSEFCKEKNKTLYQISGGGKNRAEARQAVIDFFLNYLKEEWLMFLDDDCILKPNFFKEAEKHMVDSKVGLIWGLDDVEGTKFGDYLRYQRLDPRKYAIDAFYKRGGTHDTLLRRNALEGIEIPGYLHVLEDRHIKNHVEKVGYKAVIVYEGCWHIMDYNIVMDAFEYYRTCGSIIFHRVVGDGSRKSDYSKHTNRD